jgi:hypothetical protein
MLFEVLLVGLFVRTCKGIPTTQPFHNGFFIEFLISSDLHCRVE